MKHAAATATKFRTNWQKKRSSPKLRDAKADFTILFTASSGKNTTTPKEVLLCEQQNGSHGLFSAH